MRMNPACVSFLNVQSKNTTINNKIKEGKKNEKSEKLWLR